MDPRIDDDAARLGQVLATIPGFVMVIDPDGVIRYINRVEEGFDREKVIGTPSVTFLHAVSGEIFAAALDRVVESGEETSFEVSLPLPDGSTRWYESRMFPMKEDGRVGSVLLVGADVTELRDAQEALDRLRRLLPVCAWCDRIRGEDGGWMSVEAYLKKETGTDVTHGLCPDCREREFGGGGDDEIPNGDAA